jgi:signal transduction histidine kinase/CheY-like chemotaxis protein
MRQLLAEPMSPMIERAQELLAPETPAWADCAPSGPPAALGAPHLAFGTDAAGQLRWAHKIGVLGRLTAGVAHEVKNHATLMLLRTASMLEREPAPGASRAEVEELHRTAERLARLVSQWLVLGRRDAPVRRHLDLNALVGDMTSALDVALGSGIALVTDPRAAAAHVVADRGGLEHVILNLALNARDAMAGSGTLTLWTANVELRGSADDFLLPFTVGPHVMLAVQDTGCGMDEATLARLFEPYFTTKAPGKGTGLGLQNVRDIVRENGGTLQVASVPGHGSVFAIYLPLAHGEPELRAAPPRPPQRPGKETVLVVEDEDGVRALVREVLDRQGYAVLEAADGREALNVAAAHAGPIHMLITDCVLPHVAGDELARRLLARYPGLKVLYVSGYAPDDPDLPGDVGPAAQFLEKPFAPGDLMARVRDVLNTSPKR